MTVGRVNLTSSLVAPIFLGCLNRPVIFSDVAIGDIDACKQYETISTSVVLLGTGHRACTRGDREFAENRSSRNASHNGAKILIRRI